MRIRNLEHLYVEQLKDLYNAEHQISESLPRLAEGASANELRSLFQREVDLSGRQMRQLEALFEGMNVRPTGEKCEGMAGLMTEMDKLAEMCETPEARDAALIAGLQRVKHYEIAGYGCARAFAERLGEREAADRLTEILDEESSEDERLTSLATDGINAMATEPATA